MTKKDRALGDGQPLLWVWWRLYIWGCPLPHLPMQAAARASIIYVLYLGLQLPEKLASRLACGEAAGKPACFGMLGWHVQLAAYAR